MHMLHQKNENYETGSVKIAFLCPFLSSSLSFIPFSHLSHGENLLKPTITFVAMMIKMQLKCEFLRFHFCQRYSTLILTNKKSGLERKQDKNIAPRFGQLCICLAFPSVVFVLIMHCTLSYMLGRVTLSANGQLYTIKI